MKKIVLIMTALLAVPVVFAQEGRGFLSPFPTSEKDVEIMKQLTDTIGNEIKKADEEEKQALYNLPADQQKEFDEMLPEAIKNMTSDKIKEMYSEILPTRLGYALNGRVAYWWILEKQEKVSEDEILNVTLTDQEKRAILYAIYKLIPAEYRTAENPKYKDPEGKEYKILSFQEYTNKYTVTDWKLFSQQCQTALQYVYTGVKQIADNDSHFPSDALHDLTH